jgi:hypothetical protein
MSIDRHCRSSKMPVHCMACSRPLMPCVCLTEPAMRTLPQMSPNEQADLVKTNLNPIAYAARGTCASQPVLQLWPCCQLPGLWCAPGNAYQCGFAPVGRCAATLRKPKQQRRFGCFCCWCTALSAHVPDPLVLHYKQHPPGTSSTTCTTAPHTLPQMPRWPRWPALSLACLRLRQLPHPRDQGQKR